MTAQHARRGRRRLGVAAAAIVVLVAAAGFFLLRPPGESHLTAVPVAPASEPSASPSSPPSEPASGKPSAGSTTTARPVVPPANWPGPDNTGVPAGLALHSCPATITDGGKYDRCRFAGGIEVRASNVQISRSLITGIVDTTGQTGLVISDSTLDCHCPSEDDLHTPSAIMDSNYTLLRVEILHSGHGAAVKDNVTIQDSWIHDLGNNTQAHKDGIYSGDGSNVVLRHNNIECNDGPNGGCTSAIGLLTDFGPISHWTITGNLLNTTGSYCFYATGGVQKPYTSDHIVFTGNHFGRAIQAKCGYYGPACNFDAAAPGNVWSGNVWEGTDEVVPAPED